MRFRILGPLEVWDGVEWRNLTAAKWRALLATLLVNANQVVSTDLLTTELWQDDPPAGATNQIHGLVARLRRALGDSGGRLLVTRAPGYKLVIGPADVDATLFVAGVVQGRQLLRDGNPEQAAATLREALALWRGRALADIPSTTLISGEATRLGELHRTATEARIDADLACGHHTNLIGELRQLVVAHPLRERTWQQLMTALHRSGRQAEALRVYERLRTTFAAELGTRPSAETNRLHTNILRDQPDQPKATASATAAYSAPPPAQLPPDLTTFIGREKELEQLTAKLPAEPGSATAAVVISTIDGMAGVGKTMLAVHWAHQVRDQFPDGQLFVELHGFTEGRNPVAPADALHRVLRALDVPEEQIPYRLEDRAALFRSKLATKRMLILLDNAATEDQIRPLVPAAPGCLVLITSRRRLAGLCLFHAEPLSLDVLTPADAVTLFTNTLGDTGRTPATELVEMITDLCGRLPLAIRIAAERLRTRPAWSAAYLASRLRDEQLRPAELRLGRKSVTAAFQVSYQHLDAEQQRMFRVLGLHPGLDIEPYAAAALADTPVHCAEQLLEDLLDTHLLQQRVPGRFTFHDLVRTHAITFSTQPNPQDDKDRALIRLLGYYTHTASAAMAEYAPQERDHRPMIPAPTTPVPRFTSRLQAIAWLEAERANLLAAAGHATHRWPAYAIRLAETLHRYLDDHNHHTDSLAIHGYALAAARQAAEPVSEANALHNIGKAYRRMDYYAAARDHFRRSLAVSEKSGEPEAGARAVASLGFLDAELGRHEEAANHLFRALAVFREAGDTHSEFEVLLAFGGTQSAVGNHLDALTTLEAALDLAVSLGQPDDERRAHDRLAHTHKELGNIDQAQSHARRAIDLAALTDQHQ